MEWSRIFLHDLDWSYAAELVLRTFVMFVFVLLLLRMSGKKGVRQLSLFEVAIIISFGSAAGDAMFQQDMGIASSFIVLTVIILIYRAITWMTMKSEKIEAIFEGDPEYIIEDGMFVLTKGDNHTFAKDEFLAEMRQQSIEHLGQVRVAILETNGVVSFIFYEDEQVRHGMPVLPKAYCKMSDQIPEPGQYACTYCGKVKELKAAAKCNRCDHDTWVKAIDTKRIT